ncbi:hypothetical protein Tco_0976662 [Tanacetum coccineum]|uniref:Uncharacterized protein n=1 Tax=Tanacetum coccineum TaxID=301880 RepID=A0ABQ5EHV3_9ASTR
MTSVTARQTKLDLELVPKENRLNIRKCNVRIPCGLKPKEETFQVILDALALTPCYPAFLITADVLEVPEMKKSKAYKTYLGYATGEVPPKVARKFKKASPSKKERVPDVTNDDSSESESESRGNDEDDSNNEQESSDESSMQEYESEVQELDSEQDKESDGDDQEDEEFDQENEYEDDEIKSDEEQGMDDTSDQFDDDVDARLEEPTETTTGIIQESQALEKEVVWSYRKTLFTLSKSLVESHNRQKVGETRQEFMNFLSESLTARIKEQVKDQLPQIPPQEVSNFTPLVIEKLIKESCDAVTLAKVSSQPQSSYEAASTLTEFELKNILLDKMEKSESYLMAPEHRDCYDGLKKSCALDKDFFYSYDVYSLKRGQNDNDKDEDPSAGSDRWLKKRKTSKDTEPTTGPKYKDSTFGSSKGKSKSTGKSIQSEEPVFEVADSDMPQDQAGNLGDNKDEPRDETASRRDWFKKPTPPQEPTDPDWNVGKTT